MTLTAHLVGDRDVDGVIKKGAPHRTVWIMTRGAVGISNRVILMGFQKERLVGLMAVLAETGDVLLEKMEGRGRPMGIVAIQASRGHGLMLAFRLIYGVAQFLVAIQAEFVAGELKIELVCRCMGIMAFDAIAVCNDLVAALRLFGEHRRMARVAYLAGIGRKKLAV